MDHVLLLLTALLLFEKYVGYIQNFMLYAMPVHLEDLWKIVAPVEVVEGFDLSEFSRICQKARSATEEMIEPYSMWEYVSFCAGEPAMLASVNIENGQFFCAKEARILKFRQAALVFNSYFLVIKNIIFEVGSSLMS